MSETSNENSAGGFNAWSRTPGKMTRPIVSTSESEPMSSLVPGSGLNLPSSAGWGISNADEASNRPIWGTPSRPSTLGVTSDASDLHRVSAPSGLWSGGLVEGNNSQWGGIESGGPDLTKWTGVERSNSMSSWGGELSGAGGLWSESLGAAAGGGAGSVSSGDSGGSGENRTWAQAAGKGLSESGAATSQPQAPSGAQAAAAPLTAEDIKNREQEEVYLALINGNEGWGRRPVNQTTTWEVGDSPRTQQARSQQANESIVWITEPPNGTGIWETHYESMGEKTARWQSTGPPPWSETGNTNWGERPSAEWSEKRRPMPQSAVPGAVSGRIGTWNEATPGGDAWAGSSSGGGGAAMDSGQRADDGGGNIWSMPGQQTGWSDPNGVRKPWSPSGDEGFGQGRRPLGQMNNQSRIKNENQMRFHQVRYLVGMGFRKEEAQNALINNNMDLDRAMMELRERQQAGVISGGDMDDLSGNRRGGGGFPTSPNPGVQRGGPGGHSSGMNNPQMMRQQIMQQVRYAFNNRVPGPTGGNTGPMGGGGGGGMGTSGPPPPLPPGPMQQKELQVLQNIMMLQHKIQSVQQEALSLRNSGAASNPQVFQEYQVFLQRLTMQLNNQQNQLKIIRNQISSPMGGGGPMGQSNSQGMADMLAQMNELNLQGDINEFIPGQPWMCMSPKDDPNLTPGSANRSLLSVNNDHLERLSTSDSDMLGGGGSTWLFLHSIPPHLNLDIIRQAVYQQSGLVRFVPNMPSRWVLLAFSSQEDATKAMRNLTNRAGIAEPISETNAALKMPEIQNLAARFNLPPGGGSNWGNPSSMADPFGGGSMSEHM